MEIPSSNKIYGLPEVPGSPEDYPLDKDFLWWRREPPQIKEGLDLANPYKMEINLVEGGIHTGGPDG